MSKQKRIKGGYILLARKTVDNFLMDKPPWWLKLWVWLLLKARFKDGSKLKRGQLITTIEEMRDAMAYRVGYRKNKPTRDQIRNAYEAFTKATMITTTKTTRGLIITICNYDKYQNPKNYEDHSEDHDENTAKTTEGPHYREGMSNERGMKEIIKFPNGNLSPKGDQKAQQPKCPHNEIIKTYHDTLPELPHIQVWDNTSKKQLRHRWRQDPKHQSLDYWKAYFQWVSKSEFLMGRKTDFQADLHWLVKPTNFAKVINGRYHNNQNFHDRLKSVGERWLQKQREANGS